MCLRCLRRRRPEALYLLPSELSASHVPLCKLYQVDSVPGSVPVACAGTPVPVYLCKLYQCTSVLHCTCERLHVPLCKLYQVDSVPEYLLPVPVPLYQCTCANSCHSFQTPPPSPSLPPLPLPPQFLLRPFLREFMKISTDSSKVSSHWFSLILFTFKHPGT